MGPLPFTYAGRLNQPQRDDVNTIQHLTGFSMRLVSTHRDVYGPYSNAPVRTLKPIYPYNLFFLMLLAVWAGKCDSGRFCGHLAEQREDQRISENRNGIPCHTDASQEDQPAAALEEGLSRGGLVCSATRSGFPHSGDQMHHLQL